MSSFAELQRLAKERNERSQALLASERAEREKQALAKQRAADAAAREERERQRELYAAQERRRKEQAQRDKDAALERQKRDEERRKRLEREAEEATRAKTLASLANGARRSGDRAANGAARGKADEINRGKKRAPDENRYSTLTREEKRLKATRDMLGISSSGSVRKSKGHSHHHATASSPAMLADLVKLGTKKRDNRSIEEIDRDLRAARMGAAGASTQSRRDLEAAEAQLRRQKAMDAKKAGLPHAGSSSPMPTAPSSGPSRSSAEPAVDRSSKSDRQNGAATAARTIVPPRPRSSDLTAAANFLAGVPGHLPPSSSRLASSGSSSQASASKSKRKSDEADKDKKDKKKKRKQSSRADSDSHAEGSKPSGPPRRETARDRFLREEAERKKAASSSSSSGLSGRDRGRAAHKVSYSEDDDDDDDEGSDASSMSQDTYETDSQASSDMDEGRGGVSAAIGDEIWRMFGKDRSKYVSAIDDDDDDDDMEADAESVFREEMRSAQLARKEDEREQRELERRAREKAARRGRK
ncbi:SPT2-domain-containing protein [Acaromyces ingoldii]|uniref:SPT2-domain-containing protein n=1 Tax=Acaromyces ingoldii TaxID=215250 RepID=A0A316YK73_9BASI|nr:SPT2-domain-containing protein [Acaromyces ingoldii]PWN89601.1 SPT2-domain-containing protein [Acaromyces ingoldii]